MLYRHPGSNVWRQLKSPKSREPTASQVFAFSDIFLCDHHELAGRVFHNPLDLATLLDCTQRVDAQRNGHLNGSLGQRLDVEGGLGKRH
jgi:hypothetical protein